MFLICVFFFFFFFYIVLFFFFFFFFQAEDGIRDHCVTGVQTCALPISPPAPNAVARARAPLNRARARSARTPPSAKGDGATERQRRTHLTPRQRRSEERRVGKECRSRWSPDH